MKKMMLIILISIVLCAGCRGLECSDEARGYSKVLIYENKFRNEESLNDWVMEGPGTSVWQDGKMILIPDAQKAIYDKWEQLGRRNLDIKTEYYPVIKGVIEKNNPDLLSNFVGKSGNFAGGHIVLWNKKLVTGDDYIVEYDFKPLSPIGLGIIFFSASGAGGHDVLSNELKPRYGVFESYTMSDINCYHISYWANWAPGARRTCNLRKNSGFHCLANGIDLMSADIDDSKNDLKFGTYKITLAKIGSNIKFFIDGQSVIDYTDNQINTILNDDGQIVRHNVDTGKVLDCGRIGLRQMADLTAEYSNFKVYKILQK